MSAEYSTQTEWPEASEAAEHVSPIASALDQPMDAIVIDVHPALTSAACYPYAPQPPRPCGPTGEHPYLRRLVQRAPRVRALSFQPPGHAQYFVPQRFGMSAILGMTTMLALLFGVLRLHNADPVVYLFFGLQTVVICLVQMFNGKTPRLASAIAGAVMAPLFATRLWWAAGLDVPNNAGARAIAGVCLMVTAVPIGAFFGYLTGTCAAGVFLVIDALEPYLNGRRDNRGCRPSSTEASLS